MFCIGVWAACHDLHRGQTLHLVLGKAENVFPFLVFIRVIPVKDKTVLDVMDHIPFDAQMDVAPIAEFLHFTQILGTDIKTADIADLPIDDADFAVIAVIDPQIYEPESRWEKDFHFTAMLDQFLKISTFQASGTEAVIEKADFDACFARSTNASNNRLPSASRLMM